MTNVFHLSIYSLTTLAAIMLTIAEEFPFPTIITVLLAPAAYVLNERQRRIRLGVRQANTLGGVALVLTAIEFFGVAALVQAGESTERRVLSGAHLLGYLTWISLFQDKQPRNYWWLAVLGLIQVAVGAILSSSPVFGALFFVYFFLGLWTLSVFSLFQAEQSFLSASNSSTSLLPTESVSGSGLIAQLVHHQVDDFRNSIQLDPDQQWVNKRFVAGVVGISMFAACVGAAFFILTPRIWAQQTHQFVDNDDLPLQTMTGFSNEVSLGTIGQILESNAKAFEVRFYDAHRETEIDVEKIATECGYEAPTFRGSVMGIYENGRWSVLPESRQFKELLAPSDRIGDVKQSYVLADPRLMTLFCMQPTYGAESTGDGSVIGTDLATAMLVRSSNGVGLKSNYEVFLQRPVRRPVSMPRIRQDQSDAARKIRRELMPRLSAAPQGMPRLVALAKKIKEEKVVGGDDLQLARAFESYLRESGEFSYSLRADVQDPSVDPVEDFLFNRKQGHCEYFASALALMLRAVGIPTRLVSGYKGGEKNQYTGAFVVEQRHAHAWVEAYVRDTWCTFDPTPASRDDMVREIGVQRSLAGRMREAMVSMWTQNVVRMSLDAQTETIYRPAGKWIAETVKQSVKKFGGRGDDVYEFLTNPKKWFSTQVFFVVFSIAGNVMLIRAFWRRYRPADFTWLGWIRSIFSVLYERYLDRRVGRHVEFYARFIKILKNRGRVRSRAQTPLEFAAVIEQQFEKNLASNGLKNFPTEVVALFYEIRYGEVVPSAADLQRIDSRMADFESALLVTKS